MLKNILQHPMNDFVHMHSNAENLAFEQLNRVEQLLRSLGWKGLDDYKNMYCAKDIVLNDDIIECFATHGYNVDGVEGAEVIQILRKILAANHVPFEMVHKRNGNYLKLTPIDYTLSSFLTRKSMCIPIPEHNKSAYLIPNFDMHKYLNRLEFQLATLNIGAKVLPRHRYDYVKIYNSTRIADNIIYNVDNETIYVPIPRCSDASYNYRIILFYEDDNGPIALGSWKEDQITIQVGNKDYKCTSLNTAFVSICARFVQGYAKFKAKPLMISSMLNTSLSIKAKVECTDIYLRNDHINTIMINNDIKPYYDNAISDISDGNQEKSVIQTNNQPLVANGHVSNIRVHGNHILDLYISKQKIPIKYHYDISTDMTIIDNFTTDKPLLANRMTYNICTIKSLNNQARLRIVYKDVVEDEFKWDKVQYDGFMLHYSDGICVKI